MHQDDLLRLNHSLLCLLNEKQITKHKILINNLKKNKAEEKSLEYKKSYYRELERKNNK